MKVVYEYSHLGGAEILLVRYPEWNAESYEIIAGVQARRTKISNEKTKRERALYSPIDMNDQFHQAFSARGYRELRDSYTITIPNSDIAIPGAFKQIDFVKGKLLVEVQFGKYAFMFYDLAKFQYFLTRTNATWASRLCPATRYSIICPAASRTANSWFTTSKGSSGISRQFRSK